MSNRHPSQPFGPSHSLGAYDRHYSGRTAPWDIGRPQPEMVALEEADVFGPRMLEVGCGRGALSLYLAGRGHEVVGIDAAEVAIASARAAAAGGDLDVVFVHGDVLDVLRAVHDCYDAVVDVGFFHGLTDEQRALFAEELEVVLRCGGVYAMLAFSDRVPPGFGPRRVSETEIRKTFGGPAWRVREIRPAELLSARPEMPVVDANLSIVERV